MKIAIDASRYGHKMSTGVEWYSFHIINGIIKENDLQKKHQIILYTKEKLAIQESPFLKIVYIKNRRLWTLFGLSKRIVKDNLDCLFVPSHTFPLFLPKKRIITIHDLAFKRYKNAYSFFQYYYLCFSTWFASKFATIIICPSEATKNDLVKYYNCDEKKIKVVFHGFTASDTKNRKNNFGDYLFFVGRIEKKKNITLIIKSFNILKEKWKNLNLVLAGKTGLNYDEISQEIQNSKYRNCIKETGYIDEENKNFLYKNAKCFVFPSLYEGFGIPVLEAFYHNCPVVCASSGSLPEVCGDACMLVDNVNEKELANKIDLVLSNNKIKNDLIKKGTRRLKDFSWDMASVKTYELLTNNDDK